MALNQQQLQYIIRIASEGVDRAIGDLNRVKKGLQDYEGVSKRTTKSTQNLGDSFFRLAKRAVLVIPIWQSLRLAMSSVINTFNEGAKSIVDIDLALRRAKNELVGFDNTAEILSDVKDRAVALSNETGVAIDRLIESFRLFKTAGIDVETSIAGMNTSLKGAIATNNEVEVTAKSLADVYNLMGDRITEVSGVQNKMNYIMGTIVSLMPTNVINIKEFTSAMENFLAVGKTSNLTLEETLTLIASSATLMQRGSRAGTRLTRTFRLLVDNLEDVEKFLGRGIDRDSIDQFKLLNEIFIEATRRLKEGRDVTKDINDIFGARGGLLASTLVSAYDKLAEEMERIKNLKFEDRMEILNGRFKNMKDSLQLQIEVLGRVRERLGRTFIQAATGTNDFLSALKEVKVILESLEPLIATLGSAINKGIVQPLEAISLLIGIFQTKQRQAQINQQLTDTQRRLAEEARQRGLPPGLTTQEIARARGGPRAGSAEISGNAISIDQQSLALNKEKNLELDERLAIVESLNSLGFNELQIELKKLEVLKEYTKDEDKLLEQRLRAINILTKQVSEFSNELRSSLQDSIVGLLESDVSLAGLFENVGESIRQGLLEAIAGSITDSLLKTTGLGDLFGGIFTNIRFGNSVTGNIVKGFDTGSEITRRAIISGFREGSNLIKGGESKPTVTSTGALSSSFGGVSGGSGGLAGIASLSGVTLPGFGEGGFFNQRIGGGGDLVARKPGTIGPAFEPNRSPTRGQVLGAVGGSVLLGVNQYQAAGGSSANSAAKASAFLTSAGGLATSAAALGIGAALLGPVGLALLVGGLIAGALAKTKETSADERTQTSQVTSRIDVTNKSLSNVNRNLVAIKNELSKTFILPESAAFSESNSLESQFSLDARR